MIDLHLHLDGSLCADEIIHLAQLSSVTLPTNDPSRLEAMLSVGKDCTSLAEYLQKFTLPLSVLQTAQAIEKSVHLLIGRLASQGLCYAEIRFAPQLHTKRGLSQSGAAAAAVSGLKKGIADFGMPAQLILCCMRNEGNQEQNLETVDAACEFLGKGVCAADLAGDESAYPTADFAPVFQVAGRVGLPFVIHAGETGDADSVRRAVDMGARRIGHGIHAAADSSLMRELAAKGIPLEMCFSSNLQTKCIASAAEYPLPHFLEQGIAATVNTDNMTVSGTTLRREYLLVQSRFFLGQSVLKRLALNAADAAFVSEEEKALLKEAVNSRFDMWLSYDPS